MFRGPYSDQHLRVSDAERQAVTDRLAEHFADGRLDQAEFDERVGRAMNAKTRADLAACSTTCRKQGLRRPEPPGAADRHPILPIGLVVLVAVAAGHSLVLSRGCGSASSW